MFIAFAKGVVMLAKTFLHEMKLVTSPEENKPSTEVPNPVKSNPVEPQSAVKPTQA